MQTRLARFKLRSKFDIEKLDWRCLALRGPRAPRRGARSAWRSPPTGRACPASTSSARIRKSPTACAVCDLDAYRAVRIEAGVPEMGAELDERTIPQEAGIVVDAP